MEEKLKHIYLEPNSLGAAVGSEFVECLRNDETSGAKHGPSSMDQLISLISKPHINNILLID